MLLTSGTSNSQPNQQSEGHYCSAFMRFLDPLCLGDFFLEAAPGSFGAPLPSSYSILTGCRLRVEPEVAAEDVSLEGWPTVDV